MYTFEKEVIEKTVNKLIKGDDYREEVINSINVTFFAFCMDFLKKIVLAKSEKQTLDLSWYKEKFVTDKKLTSEDMLINSGLNKKTVSNIYKTANRKIVETASENNFNYLEELLTKTENEDNEDIINACLNLQYNDIKETLNLSECLLVMNTLATKKLAIRGGAWSAIGKKVEKPLIDKLCDLALVPIKNRDKVFVKDASKDFDREVDYKLIDSHGKKYCIEVKLMGKGNPESADVTIARGTDILIADTLSLQNKAQLKDRGVYYVELKRNNNTLNCFKKILAKLSIPHKY